MEFAAAILLGFAGSLHCAGMCGPIALALPRAQGVSHSEVVLGRLLYNGGRILTYALLGFIVGLGGSAFSLAGYGRTLSIVAGALMLVFALAQMSGTNPLQRMAVRFPGVERGLRGMMHDHRLKALFGIGALNGLLPCGMVTAALLGAVGTGSAVDGSLFMAIFGVGTVPMMFGIALGGVVIGPRVRRVFRFVAPVVTVTFGLVFILRGMALDIPLLSPPDAQRTGRAECCTPTANHPGSTPSPTQHRH